MDQMDQVREIAQAVRHHHERYDVRGYPDGLSRRDPLMSRIIAICDATTSPMTALTERRRAATAPSVK